MSLKLKLDDQHIIMRQFPLGIYINDSYIFWVCPPIIHSDFDVEPEDFHISKPQKIDIKN